MRQAIMLISLAALAACANGGGGLTQAMDACRAGNTQACNRLPTLANEDASALQGGMSHGNRVAMDVAAMLAGMQRARAHELVAGRVGP